MTSTDAAAAVREQRTITLTGARAVLDAALAKSEEIGARVAVAVVDTGGHQIASARQDGALQVGVDLANRKAFTAAVMSVSTKVMWEVCAADPMLVTGLAGDESLLILAGGHPIVDGSDVVGAVGVSGGFGDQDVAIAEHGAAALSGDR